MTTYLRELPQIILISALRTLTAYPQYSTAVCCSWILWYDKVQFGKSAVQEVCFINI